MTQNNLPPTAMGNRELETPEQSRWSKWLEYLRYKGDWLEETRGSLMVVANLITTITFQPALSPPGGFCGSGDNTCAAGTSVLANSYGTPYVLFILSNSISFTASLCVTLLLISGFPLKNKVFMGILTFAMCTTLTFLGVTYVLAFAMVVPDLALDHAFMLLFPIFVLLCLIAVVVLIHTIRFLHWLLKKIRSSPIRANALTHLKSRLGWTRL
ncbi:hypothetical protein CFP56_040329 [Quercus suber]|uniref:PGG domain-containing protein n=1 Tax=Quercus suber TaxID=58331 RepID=A0AAW0LMD9_QUESU